MTPLEMLTATGGMVGDLDQLQPPRRISLREAEIQGALFRRMVEDAARRHRHGVYGSAAAIGGPDYIRLRRWVGG